MITAKPIMDLLPIDQVRVSAQTQDMFGQAEELARKVNSFRPMSGDLIAKAQERLFPIRIYNSNAIEGSRVTLQETQMILEGEMLPSPRERDGQEVINLRDAIRMVETEMVFADNPWTEDAILKLHHCLMKDVHPKAGVFRDERVMLRNAKYQPPRVDVIESTMERILATASQFNVEASPLLLAAWVHWSLARLHPFFDGNGRISRLCSDLVLLRARLAPAIIRVEDRPRYDSALQEADEGEFNPFLQLVAIRTSDTLSEYVRAQQEITLLKDWAVGIAAKASPELKKPSMPYLQWRYKMESIQHDFQRCVAKAAEAGLDIQMRSYPVLEEAAWTNLQGNVFPFFEVMFGIARGEYAFSFSFERFCPAMLSNELNGNSRELIELKDLTIELLLKVKHGQDSNHIQVDGSNLRNKIELRSFRVVGNEILASFVKLHSSETLPVFERSTTAIEFAMKFIEQAIT